MLHRPSTWWRALSVVLLGVATVTWPTAAQAATTASFYLIHQGAATVLSPAGGARFSVSLELATRDDRALAQLSLYPRIVTRGEIESIVAGVGTPTRSVATTGNFRLDCATSRRANFTIDLFTTSPSPSSHPCTSSTPRLRLPCRGPSCDGVYPVTLSVTNGGVTTTEWSLIAVQATTVSRPVRVSLIATLGPASWRHPARAIAVLDLLAHYASTPLALSADYRTLLAVLSSTSPEASAWRASLSRALKSPAHVALSAPPGDVDFGGLAVAGLTSQVGSQLSLAGQLLYALTKHSPAHPVLLSGAPSVSSLQALANVGVRDVVLPENSLETAPSSTLTWGAPFRVPGERRLTALATDGPLDGLMIDSSIEPGRRAVLALDTLAFLHFEAPDAPSVRSVVVTVAVAGTSPTFISDLLSGFAHDPFFVASPLAPAFASSLVATNGAPANRPLGTTPSSMWSARNVSTLAALATAVNSFGEAVASTDVADQLRVALAESEVVGGAGQRQSLITAATSQLDQQLGLFSVGAAAITLTGTGTALPITVLSRANYTVTAVVHLITDRLSFPKGDSIAVTLDAPTKSIRVATANHRGSSLTLQVIVTTPDGQVTLARAAVQVRIAGTSVVGYLLTIGSLLVLAIWWWRTYRRRSRGLHAR